MRDCLIVVFFLNKVTYKLQEFFVRADGARKRGGGWWLNPIE